MFPFGGFAYTGIKPVYIHNPIKGCGWVSPFGHPRIHGCMRLPADYRGLPRPSSPPESSHPLRGVRASGGNLQVAPHFRYTLPTGTASGHS